MTPEQVLERLGKAALVDDLPIRAADAIDDATDTIKDMVAEIARLREGLEAAIRAAKLSLFVIRKQGIMPNSSWESGFDADMKTAEAAMTVPNGER